jgi:hypothetical protein
MSRVNLLKNIVLKSVLSSLILNIIFHIYLLSLIVFRHHLYTQVFVYSLSAMTGLLWLVNISLTQLMIRGSDYEKSIDKNSDWWQPIKGSPSWVNKLRRFFMGPYLFGTIVLIIIKNSFSESTISNASLNIFFPFIWSFNMVYLNLSYFGMGLAYRRYVGNQQNLQDED